MRSFDPGHRNKLPPPWKTSTIRRFLGSLLFYFTPVFYLRFLRFPFKYFSTFINNNITLNNLNNRTNLNSFKCLGKNHRYIFYSAHSTIRISKIRLKNLPPSIKNPTFSSPSRIGKEKNSRNGKDDTGTSGMEKILARPRNGFQPLALIYPVFRI